MKKKLGAILLALVLAISLGVVPAALVGATPGPGIVGLWHLDESSGTNASDSSGNINDGTLTNMSTPSCWVSGMFGNALSFDGVDDYVSIANESNFDFERDDAFTVEVWVKTSSNATTMRIITKMQNSLPKTGWSLNTYDDGTTGPLLYFVLRNNNLNKIRVHGSSDITDGLWHHVAVTYDGSSSASGVQIYVDGSPETMTVTDDTLSATIQNNVPLQISGREGSNYVFDGIIDEVRIWDTAYPEYTLTSSHVGPTVNPVTTDHQITATVTPAVPGITVHFDITGPNSANSGTAVTDGSGVATFTYTGDFGGTDTIHVWIDQDWDGSEDVSASPDLTKQWVVNFVTGGAKINCNNSAVGLPGGKKPAFTFAGTVGFLPDMSIVGQFQVVVHIDIGLGIKGAIAIHLNSFSSLVFDGVPTGSPPATFNRATFTGTGFSNKGIPVGTMTITITDNGEPGKGNDTIEILFPEGPITFTIDGGNFQVHDGYKSP